MLHSICLWHGRAACIYTLDMSCLPGLKTTNYCWYSTTLPWPRCILGSEFEGHETASGWSLMIVCWPVGMRRVVCRGHMFDLLTSVILEAVIEVIRHTRRPIRFGDCCVLRCLQTEGASDRQTDGQTDTLIKSLNVCACACTRGPIFVHVSCRSLNGVTIVIVWWVTWPGLTHSETRAHPISRRAYVSISKTVLPAC